MHSEHTTQGRLSRRRMLQLMAASGLLLSGPKSRAERPARTPVMRTIPSTGEAVPAMGLGSSNTFETGPWSDLGDLTQVLKVFAALGGKVVDTSPSYGNAEMVIGDLARQLHLTGELFMATKVHAWGRQAGIDQLHNSERLLGKEPLDLVQVHNFIDIDTQYATLRAWKEAGRIRYVGITHYLVSAFERLEQWMRREPLDFVQFNYSVLTPDAEERLLPLAHDRGIAVLINRPFDDGGLFRRTRGKPLPDWARDFQCDSWAQFGLKYVLGHRAVTCAIPATSKPAHLADNMQAGFEPLPDAAMRRRMRRYLQDLPG